MHPGGSMIRSFFCFFSDRDKNEELLEITEEKKREIMSKENAKSASSTTRGGRFSHKEKALKIYTDDNQPKK
ncbi:hypothetical protein P5673_012647 [Acropora cervicornis]|uniref:Ubiquitin carboxyl-terminal hydrolase 47 C-terminal domain-containing protein n=1 Tax=Acropora cervicornis TaxID=6130 RepID=A0AAD9QLS9_ACRCE|nr:hypothetical protein P5673_012647 [Acropora cervicornis]